MIMTSLVVGVVLTVVTLLLTLLTISKGYSFKHTIDPLKEEDKVREFTGNGKRI
ncbi:YtzI protein [Pseudogracilibacillus auburnensis]|uniref:Tumor necrosis factor receptor superfamily member 19 n=1 Tax=Pseudogracilibacillus auburnensis TaxID=1494959 RepID=A0A2V3W0J9_9BACI|nr:YtzI protein [Pseudogracilibacillus auburnensis]MBO1002677.1 YtzI protein [Pseudogracilibacillus auburnensis]PXW86704.1 tumor necrosis factor receptor superfamily member 19 [Pseudogracilibacillus auburnensis]